jgi:CO/xanthine dehydrogenase FAD-binding subunit
VKPAKFAYVRAESVDQVVEVLDGRDGEAIILAGGQTLLPLLSMRLARPDVVVDINHVAELSGIAVSDGEGGRELIIKACTRQADALASPLIQEHVPLLAKAIGFIGHQQTRNRGTVGGSLSHADPASEIPLAALTLDAWVSLRSVSGTRRVALSDYFIGPMMTARADNEILLAVHFPLAQGHVGAGFHEVSERRGDFAVVAAAALIQCDQGGICTHAALAIGGAGGTPLRITALEDQLTGSGINEQIIKAALPMISAAIDPDSDQHAAAAYRERVAGQLAERALLDALADALADGLVGAGP